MQLWYQAFCSASHNLLLNSSICSLHLILCRLRCYQVIFSPTCRTILWTKYPFLMRLPLLPFHISLPVSPSHALKKSKEKQIGLWFGLVWFDFLCWSRSSVGGVCCLFAVLRHSLRSLQTWCR